MTSLFTFNKTVRGYNHIRKDIPCEDYSDSYTDEKDRFRIITVCDGHGDSACLRSAFGAKALTEVTMEALKQFAEVLASEEENVAGGQPMHEQMDRRRTADIMIRRLTDSILMKWYDVIFKDLEEHPLTAEEIEEAGRYRDRYATGERLAHVYGTTLITALWMDRYLLLIQQGDGRCDVFHDNGEIDQPIPWDPRCHDNVTSSMCDEDAAESIRHCLIYLENDPVTACYMGSDGVEDAYLNNDDQSGTHVFYGNLSVDIIGRGPEQTEDYLESFLPEFSQEGSGDDVSVAGIIDMEKMPRFLPELEKAGKRYHFLEQKRLYENKLISMTRKRQKLNTDVKAFSDKLDGLKKELDIQEKKLSEYYEKMRQLEANVSSEREKVESMLHEIDEGENFFNVEKGKDGTPAGSFVFQMMEKIKGPVAEEREKLGNQVNELLNRETKGRSKVELQEQLVERLREETARTQADYLKNQQEQQEYEERYLKFEDGLQQIISELEKLDSPKSDNGLEENLMVPGAGPEQDPETCLKIQEEPVEKDQAGDFSDECDL